MKSENMVFIAEIGLNHNGNFGLFFELIKQASLAGAHYAKFQLGWRAKDGEINALGFDELDLIQKCCNYHGIKPLVSIFTQDAWTLAKEFNFDAYKIASRTVIDDKNLANEVASSGKTVFVSLGMTEERTPLGVNNNIEYLWCKSEYPALPWSLKDLPKDFNAAGLAGYSDHSVGIEVPLMTIMRGARVIEKHFTLDKSDTTIRDHALSATPNEFAELVRLGTSIKRNLDLGM